MTYARHCHSLIVANGKLYAVGGFSPEALEEIATLASKRKTGARALRSILEKVLLEAKYEIPGSDIKKIYISAETVRGETGYRAETQSDTDRDNRHQDNRSRNDREGHRPTTCPVRDAENKTCDTVRK
ncbi:hypothetical protein WR25_15990 [Diploscapter pachys]|uniref:Uncharacterized protein n=1 Tax=Diploscapter pachys TaxID=2018661 RepID=A0A2A2M0W6_9BILA|nr:hypothetical protein WR25_15990 [Diploscapter pachys]